MQENPLSTRLRVSRDYTGLTQREVASRIGTHFRNYSRYECGTSTPNTDQIVSLCKLYNVSSDFLLGLTNDPTPHWTTSSLAKDERSQPDRIILTGIDGVQHTYIVPENLSRRVEALLRAGVPTLMGAANEP